MENQTPIEVDEIVQYFVVNKELGMSTGKTSVQVARVASMIALDMSNHTCPPKLMEYVDYFHDWFSSDLNKIIILGGKEKDLNKLIDEGFYFTIDNGLTEIPPNSLTVVGLPPMPKSLANKFIKRLQTHK